MSSYILSNSEQYIPSERKVKQITNSKIISTDIELDIENKISKDDNNDTSRNLNINMFKVEKQDNCCISYKPINSIDDEEDNDKTYNIYNNKFINSNLGNDVDYNEDNNNINNSIVIKNENDIKKTLSNSFYVKPTNLIDNINKDLKYKNNYNKNNNINYSNLGNLILDTIRSNNNIDNENNINTEEDLNNKHNSTTPYITQRTLNLQNNNDFLSCKNFTNWYWAFLSILIGLYSTNLISYHSKINSFFVGNLTNLLSTFLLPGNYIGYFHAGSFSGMINFKHLNYNYGFLALDAIITFLYFQSFKTCFIGAGGKLGFISFTSNLTTCLLIFIFSKIMNYEYSFPLYVEEYYHYYDFHIFFWGPLFSSFTALCCYLLQFHFPTEQTTFKSVGIIGTIFNMLMLTFNKLLINTEDVKVSYGILFSAHINIGIFMGLGAISRYKQFFQSKKLNGYIWYHYVFNSYIAAWVGIGTHGILSVGGKHGFCTFIGFYIYYYINKVFFKVVEK